MFVFMNTSAVNGSTVKMLTGTDYIVYNSLFLGGLLIPVFVVDLGLIITILFCRVGISGIVRFLLLNILVSCVLLALGLIMHRLAGIILASSGGNMDLNMDACGFILWVIVSGSTARVVFMAVYAVTVYVIVKGKPQFLQKLPVSIALSVVMWVVILILCALYVGLPITGIGYTVGLSCTLYSMTDVAYVFEAVMLLLLGVVPFIVSLTIPIVTICHIRKKTHSKDTEFHKAIAKFAFFLVIGNFFNLLAVVFPFITFAVATSSAYYTMNIISVYAPYAVLAFSLVPTPILILAYFKNVRTRVKHIITFCTKSKDRRGAHASITVNDEPALKKRTSKLNLLK